jgi:hypothetical protein
MYKKITMVLTMATILTAFISALVLSNQAFAQHTGQVSTGRSLIGNVLTQVGKVLTGHEAQLGKVLGGGNRMIGLGCVWNPFDPC